MLEVDPRSSRGQSSEFGLMTRSVAEDVGDCALDRAPPLEILRSTKKSPKTFRRLLLLRTQRRPKAGECSRRCTASSSHCLPNVCVLSSQCSAPKGALHPCHVSRGVRFELLVNEANPVLGLPRTTKVSETPLKLKNAPLLKCCQPACLNHLSALNAQELFATDLMPPLLKP